MNRPPEPSSATGPDLALVMLDDDGRPFLVLTGQPATPASPADVDATVATEATGGRR